MVFPANHLTDTSKTEPNYNTSTGIQTAIDENYTQTKPNEDIT